MKPRIACCGASLSRFAPGILSILGLLGALAVPGVVLAAPDAAIDKRHTAAFVVGQNGTYTLIVRNLGTTATSGTSTVQDTLPAGLTYVSASGAGWSTSHVGQIVTGTYAAAIAAGDSAKFTLTTSVGVVAFPAVINSATVSIAGDANNANNRDTDPTAITGVADLTIDKRHTLPFTVGQNGSYSFVVSNMGTSATLGASTVRDTLPAGLTYVTAAGTGWSFSPVGQIVVATYLGAIAAGDSAQFSMTVSVGPAAFPSVTNSATVSTPSDVNPSNNRDTDPTATAGGPDLTVDKRHTAAFSVGVMGTYFFVVRNDGTSPTTGATTVRDTLPSGLTVLTTSAPGWTVTQSPSIISASYAGVIAPGDSAAFTLFVNVNALAVPSVTNYASVSTAGDVNGTNDRDSDPTAVSGGLDLAVDKRHTGAFTVGQSGSYTFVVRNVGTAVTSAVTTLRDTLPAGLTFVAVAGAGWTFSVVGQIVTVTYTGPIAAGDSAQFTMTVGVGPAAVPSVTNTATVSTAGDANPSNDRDADPTAVAFAVPAYSITSVADVGNDQGRKVRVRWNREPNDAVSGDTTITSYSIWRRIAPHLLVRGTQTIDGSNGVAAYPPGDWDYVTSVPAHGEATYSTICETLCDSTIAQGICRSVFFIRAETANPLIYFDTAPDSGYSVDNLPPVPPAALVGSYVGGTTLLQWQPNDEADLWYYRVYRGTSQDFVPAPGNLIATSSGTSYSDPGVAGRYYKLAAVDVSGNASGFTVLTPSQTLGVPHVEPVELALEAVRPNPSHGSPLQVAFTLPSNSPARIEVLDVAGRRLVAREVGSLGAGRHVVDLTRGRTLSPGLYLVRLTQGASVRNARALVLD